ARASALETGRRRLAELGVPSGERALARELSGGTRQKLNLGLALLGDPRVLLPRRALPGLRSRRVRELLGSRRGLARAAPSDRRRHALPGRQRAGRPRDRACRETVSPAGRALTVAEMTAR